MKGDLIFGDRSTLSYFVGGYEADSVTLTYEGSASKTLSFDSMLIL